MGFNVSQIKCADCAAFSPHSGFVSLSVHPYFVRQNTDEPIETENQGVLWC